MYLLNMKRLEKFTKNVYRCVFHPKNLTLHPKNVYFHAKNTIKFVNIFKKKSSHLKNMFFIL